jgi:hypothetical protein
MRVSSRYAAMLVAVAGTMVASAAAAGQHAPTPPSPPPPSHHPCCTHPGGPTIHAPNVYIGGPNIHVGGPNIHVGGVYLNNSVNINVTATANATANAMANASGSGGGFGGGGNTFIYSGGGYIGGGTAPAATALTGLRLAGAASAAAATYEMVEEERTRWVEGWRVVRVVCVDDTGTPHPASRPDPNERVDAHFDGEIFRCMAGTALQATIGWREDGHDRYDGGDTIHCRKGEALRHAPGGRLSCAPQEPERNCNERSLLRLHGPGIKLIYYRYEEVYTETVRREVARAEAEASASASMTLMLNGGVGGYN